MILYATLTDDMTNTVSGQNISFYVNGTLVGSRLSIEGYINLTYILSGSKGDEFSINGSYNGSGSFGIITRQGLLRILYDTNSTIVTVNTTVGKYTTINSTAVDSNGNPLDGVNLTVIVDGAGFRSLSYIPMVEGLFNLSVSWGRW